MKYPIRLAYRTADIDWLKTIDREDFKDLVKNHVEPEVPYTEWVKSTKDNLDRYVLPGIIHQSLPQIQ